MQGTTELSFDDGVSYNRVTGWLWKLGVTEAPQPRAGLQTALWFFKQQMPTLKIESALDFLRAMDLSRPVRIAPLRPGEKVIAFRVQGEADHKLFYTRPGAPKHALGINLHRRLAVQFEVVATAMALESYTSGVIDVWSQPADWQRLWIDPRSSKPDHEKYGVMVAGGGVQLMIPTARNCLQVSHRQTEVRAGKTRLG